jgi:hypothetical protein
LSRLSGPAVTLPGLADRSDIRHARSTDGHHQESMSDTSPEGTSLVSAAPGAAVAGNAVEAVLMSVGLDVLSRWISLHPWAELLARDSGSPGSASAVPDMYNGDHYASLLTDFWCPVWAYGLRPSAPPLAPLAGRPRGTHGAPMGLVAWPPSRWRTQHLGATTDASYASRGLIPLSPGCGSHRRRQADGGAIQRKRRFAGPRRRRTDEPRAARTHREPA